VTFERLKLSGACAVRLERFEDHRGFFARSWCQREFAEHGLTARLVQCNISFTRARGTIRGMHYQVPPREEAKLVRCTAGAIYDVIIDLRPDSPTFRQWIGIELTAANRVMLHVPEGFAHGFQTLEDDTEVFYQMSEYYEPELARGVRWDDPAFGMRWPIPDPILSDRDRSFPDYAALRG
jgi:dTDP-4-dehydrorhamnose 3,5-epimerase